MARRLDAGGMLRTPGGEVVELERVAFYRVTINGAAATEPQRFPLAARSGVRIYRQLLADEREAGS